MRTIRAKLDTRLQQVYSNVVYHSFVCVCVAFMLLQGKHIKPDMSGLLTKARLKGTSYAKFRNKTHSAVLGRARRDGVADPNAVAREGARLAGEFFKQHSK